MNKFLGYAMSACTILNRDFLRPPDEIYQIEVSGEHPLPDGKGSQVMDATARESIVADFKARAEKAGFAGMVIDRDHLKHNLNEETRALGWLMSLENRESGLFGRIVWTKTGAEAVDGGDYRFFSTEYDVKDFQVLSREPLRIRPLRLSGLTVTNMPNNKGGAPITTLGPSTYSTPGEDVPVLNSKPAVQKPTAQMPVEMMAGQELSRLVTSNKKENESFDFVWNRVVRSHPKLLEIANRDIDSAEQAAIRVFIDTGTEKLRQMYPQGQPVLNRFSECVGHVLMDAPLLNYPDAVEVTRRRYPEEFWSMVFVCCDSPLV